MDLADLPENSHGEDNAEETLEALPQSPRKLPDDLPKSLDDRRPYPSYGGETEMYDAWQGISNSFSEQLPLKLMLCSRWNRLVSIPHYPNLCEAACL